MAAPTFLGSDASSVITATSGALAPDLSARSANDVLLYGVLQDGTGADVTVSAISASVANLAGTASALTSIGAFNVGSAAVAKLHLWIGRLVTPGATSVTFNSSSGNDLYTSMWAFRTVSSGTTLATVIENATAGSTTTTAATSATLTDAGVTTLGPDRLAVNVVGGNDDNALTVFTGMTGGTWTEDPEFASATGTDGVIGMQYAAMASAGTIDGGSSTWADALDGWGVVGFALIGTTVAAMAPVPVGHYRKMGHLLVR